MARAELFALLYPFDVGPRHGFAHTAAAVAVDDVHPFRARPPGRLDDVAEQRTTGEEMEDLRQVRSHALSLPGREDDHV